MQENAGLSLNGAARPMGPRLLSLREVVETYGGTIWYWRSQIWGGKLPFIQVGRGNRKMLIDTRDLESFIARFKQRVEL